MVSLSEILSNLVLNIGGIQQFGILGDRILNMSIRVGLSLLNDTMIIGGNAVKPT